MATPKLFLIDGSNYFYRAFHALTRLSVGALPTNATYGFTSMLFKILQDYEPEYVAVVWDTAAPTFRDKLYAEYKATRAPMPDDLSLQIPWIHKVTEVLRVAGVELDGYEADDVIGTLTRRAERAGLDVVIVTGDKDFLQLVSERTTLLDTMKDKISGFAEVKERFGTTPDKVADVLGLSGDAVDNVPGIPGVGEKTAAKLIAEHGSLEQVLAATGKMKYGKLRENLETHGDLARLSRTLATIDCEAPVAVELEALRRVPPDAEAAVKLFRELEFNRFLTMFEAQRAPTEDTKSGDYRVITDAAGLEAAVAEIRKAGRVAFDTETDALDALRAKMVGLSLAVRPGAAWYIPVAHDYPDVPKQIAAEEVRRRLAPLFDDPAIAKIAFHAKFDIHVLTGFGLRVRGLVSDPMIASYLLEPGRKNHGLKDLVPDLLGKRMETFEEVMRKAAPEASPQLDLFKGGGSAGAATFARVPVDAACAYCSADSDFTLQLHERFAPRLDAAGLRKLHDEVEIPLVAVLADMERAGVLVDRPRLEAFSRELAIVLARLTGEIHALAGGEFNIDSPKQLAEVLFERLKLSPGRKTKTGYSTDVAVLEKLAREHELPKRLLEYRGLAKLKSGYVDSLPELVDPGTGRIHTSYSQTVAATGRLASSDPNLQNIPIRSEEGRKIRAAFVAPPGCVLLSADYSQIELRILAHLSGDPVLSAAFREGRDVHAETAARIFDVPPGLVSKEMRARAKTINFGVIYGMGAHGLASSLEISHGEAEKFIASYYERYPLIRAYLDGQVEEARRTGVVKTMLGRIRPMPDLQSNNPMARGTAERISKNTPIQGSAADMIKVAMIRAHADLAGMKTKARMLLQVHDELVFEVPEGEFGEVAPRMKAAMENAVPMSVPIVVDLKRGVNWAEMIGV